MADEACSHGAVDRLAFVMNLLGTTELSAATVKGNSFVFHACMCQLAKVTGKAFQIWGKPGKSCPHAEVG